MGATVTRLPPEKKKPAHKRVTRGQSTSPRSVVLHNELRTSESVIV